MAGYQIIPGGSTPPIVLSHVVSRSIVELGSLYLFNLFAGPFGPGVCALVYENKLSSLCRPV